MGQEAREKLESYRDKREEARELRHKLEHLMDGDCPMGSPAADGYPSGHPVPQAAAVGWGQYCRRKERYESQIAKLERECDEAEEYVCGVGDPLTRRILRMYYLEGRKQKEIAEAVHMDRSTVSKKISDYFKLSHKSH